MMENFSWLNAFREMGKRVSSEMGELREGSGGGRALGRGAAGDTTLVLDKRAEEAVMAVLAEARESGEEFTLISEEIGEKPYGEGEVVILADPIDGSNNAKYGLPMYSTSLALATGRRLCDVSLGYIIDLGTGDEYWALKGQGAFKNGRRISSSGRVEIGMVNFETPLPCRDLPAAMPLLCAARKVRCMGSTALDLAHLASGATDIVLVPSPSRSFDYAAGWLILAEAGGLLTDTKGGPLDATALGVERTTPLLGGSNAEVHGKALRALSGVKS